MIHQNGFNARALAHWDFKNRNPRPPFAKKLEPHHTQECILRLKLGDTASKREFKTAVSESSECHLKFQIECIK